MSDVSQLLRAIADGDNRSTERLFPIVYEELRRIARNESAKEKPGQTLQATALVHEAYLRLVGPTGESGPDWENRGHFFAAAAEAMRRILVENARRKNRLKRGGGADRVPLSDGDKIAYPRDEDLLDLDDALEKLNTIDPQKAALVKLRFFAGLTTDEAAAMLGISVSTAERSWAYARAWLRRAIEK
jgi:RNA polymerase sigma factor (TIGR02999 family)